MKLLTICYSTDLSLAGGGIPVFWQLFRGLHAAGVEVIVITLEGASFSSPWWRNYPKPSIHNKAFAFALSNNAELIRRTAGFLYHRFWKKHFKKIFAIEKDITAVLLTSAIHVANEIPSWIRKNFGVPTIYYETDIQNLPKYSLDHKLKNHSFPDYSDCDAVLCSFEKISQELRNHGLKNVWTVPFGADTLIFSPIHGVEQKVDVFFSGFGEIDREEWMYKMITKPSMVLTNTKFLVEGSFKIFLGNTKTIRSVSLDKYLHLCCGSKINLNILRNQFITAGVLNSRIFELASLGCCVVTNPSDALTEFFEPNREIVVVNDEKDIIDKYKWLLSSKEDRSRIGKAARQRVLKEHTYLHRAKQIVNIIKKLNV